MSLTRSLPANHDHPIVRLSRAVVIQAARDATAKDELDALLARLWLLDDEAEEYCHLGNVNYRAVVAWIVAGCPAWASRKRGRKSMNLS